MAYKTHLLAIPLPFQGHINPMLQFCKRLASRGIMVTLATIASSKIMLKTQLDSINIEFIPDTNGLNEADSLHAFVERFTALISQNIPDLVEKKAGLGEPVKVILHDSQLPLALETVYKLGIPVAAFFTQSCAVCAIYNHVRGGRLLKVPLEKPNNIVLPGLPVLESGDLPSFVNDPCAYPDAGGVLVAQISIMEKADWIFFNTFDDLEKEVLDWTKTQYHIKTIGPAIPSMYLDKRMKDDTDYTLSLFKTNSEDCIIKWLDSKKIGSVVYVSFGSLSDLKENQMQEIAWGLLSSNVNFLWVIRPSEVRKIPTNFTSEKGLIVNWCPQLEVLSHQAVGCFLTHCGWNSTLEALSLGVRMVTLPIWVEQTTNSKYIVDVWEAGVRVKVGESGMATRKEIERSIKEVMHSDMGNELKKNSLKWKKLAIEAMSEGGSSDQNIEEFVSSIMSI